MDNETVLPLVVYGTTAVYVISGVLSMITRPNVYDQVGQGGLSDAAETVPATACANAALGLAAEHAERELGRQPDARRPQRAAGARRAAPLDVEAELRRLDRLAPTAPMVAPRTSSKRFAADDRPQRAPHAPGARALDVEDEIQRALVELELRQSYNARHLPLRGIRGYRRLSCSWVLSMLTRNNLYDQIGQGGLTLARIDPPATASPRPTAPGASTSAQSSNQAHARTRARDPPDAPGPQRPPRASRRRPLDLDAELAKLEQAEGFGARARPAGGGPATAASRSRSASSCSPATNAASAKGSPRSTSRPRSRARSPSSAPLQSSAPLLTRARPDARTDPRPRKPHLRSRKDSPTRAQRRNRRARRGIQACARYAQTPQPPSSRRARRRRPDARPRRQFSPAARIRRALAPIGQQAHRPGALQGLQRSGALTSPSTPNTPPPTRARAAPSRSSAARAAPNSAACSKMSSRSPPRASSAPRAYPRCSSRWNATSSGGAPNRCSPPISA